MHAQGRGLSTQAYTHSLERGHHMFMKLDNGKVRRETDMAVKSQQMQQHTVGVWSSMDKCMAISSIAESGKHNSGS